jgi:hypothetical protein
MTTVSSAAENLRMAKKQRAFHSAKDYETSASQLGEIQPTEITAKRRVAELVAERVPRDEIIETLMMLGIHPSQPDWTDGPVTGTPRHVPDPRGA